MATPRGFPRRSLLGAEPKPVLYPSFGSFTCRIEEDLSALPPTSDVRSRRPVLALVGGRYCFGFPPPLAELAGYHAIPRLAIPQMAPTRDYSASYKCAPPTSILHLSPLRREDARIMPRAGCGPGSFRKISSRAGQSRQPGLVSNSRVLQFVVMLSLLPWIG